MLKPPFRWPRRVHSERSDELSCRTVIRHLQSYIDGHLDEESTEACAEHLTSCPYCATEADLYRGLKMSLARQSPLACEEVTTVGRLQEYGQTLIYDTGVIRSIESSH